MVGSWKVVDGIWCIALGFLRQQRVYGLQDRSSYIPKNVTWEACKWKGWGLGQMCGLGMGALQIVVVSDAAPGA